MRKRYEAEAKERHEKLSGRPSKNKPMENFPQVSGGTSRDALGKQFGISGRTAERGTKVVELGISELQEAVWEGDVGLVEGERIAKIGKDTPSRYQTKWACAHLGTALILMCERTADR